MAAYWGNWAVSSSCSHRGGKAAIGFGAATAAVTAGILIYQRLRDAIKEAVEEQQKLNEAVHEGQQAKQDAAAQIGGALAAGGALTGENMRAATSMYDQLRKTYGVKDAGLAGLAAIAGVSPEEAAVLGAMGRRGVAFGSPEQMQQALAQARKEGTYGTFAREADVWAKTAGMGVVAEAMIPGARGRAERRPIDIAYEALRKELPEGMTREEFGQRLDELREAERKMVPLREELAGLGGRAGAKSFGVRAVLSNLEPLEELVREYGWMGRIVEQLGEVQARGPFGAGVPPEGTGPGPAAPAQTIYNINEQINAGHVQMGPDKRNSRHMVRMGVSKQDIRKPP